MNSSLLFIRGLVGLLLGAVLGGIPIASEARLSSGDLDAISLLVLGPKDNEIRNCVDLSLDAVKGFVALQNKSGDEMNEILTKGEMSDSLRAMGQTQAKMWAVERSPAKLANYQLDWCMAEHGHPTVTLGELGDRCFGVAMIPAFASLLKSPLNKTKEQAIEMVTQNWGARATPDFLRHVVTDIYAASGTEEKPIFRKVFIGCLRTNNEN